MPRGLVLSLLGAALAFGIASAQAAIDIQFNYSYDYTSATGTSFFVGPANAARRAALEAAAALFESRLADDYQAGIITPPYTWSLELQHPGGGQLTVVHPVVPANVITIYVGAQSLDTLAESSFDYYATGTSAFVTQFTKRFTSTQTDSLGGSISFNADAPWYFDTDPGTLESFSAQYDFYSVAVREIAQLLGFTSEGEASRAFNADVTAGSFAGSNLVSLAGGAVPLNASHTGWVDGYSFQGVPSAMVENLALGERRYFTEADFAVLRDIGYNISPVPEPSSALLNSVCGVLLLAVRRWRLNPAHGH